MVKSCIDKYNAHDNPLIKYNIWHDHTYTDSFLSLNYAHIAFLNVNSLC